MMVGSFISRIVIIVFGTLYPAYASYKAVKTKNVKEYVKWMMYWIVFALFSSTETFTDIFFSWIPFYYEVKIILLIWLLSPATKGSSILYRKFVHPMLSNREQEIDEYINKAKQRSYRQVLDLGQKGVTVLMQTALKGGGGLVNQLKKSYSLSDLSDQTNEGNDEIDEVLLTDPRLIRRRKPGRSPHRSSSASSATVYFSESDHTTSKHSSDREKIVEVKSAEDISSGYSSGDGIYASHQPLKLHSRDSIQSHRPNSLTRSRSTRVTRSNLPKKMASIDDSDENEEFDTNIIFDNTKPIQNQNIDEIRVKHDSSSSETEFFDIIENNNANNEFLMHGKVFDDSHKNSIIANKLIKDFTGTTLDLADSKITACKTNTSYELNLNLRKLSQALSSFYPFIASSRIRPIDDPIPIGIINNSSTNKIEENTKTPEEVGIIETNNIKPVENEMLETVKQNIEKSVDDNNEKLLEENCKKDITNKCCRGGKYNKKQAPVPPGIGPASDKPNPIKATLILQPGIVKNISRSAENLNKEVFLNYSPKLKRRSRNHSPVSSNSSESNSSNNNKIDSALNKVFRLSKKMIHLNIPGRNKGKRNSWSDFLHPGKKLSNENSISNGDIVRSKSTNSLQKPIGSGITTTKCDSQLSLDSFMKYSPLTRRRIKIIRKYVDNDID